LTCGIVDAPEHLEEMRVADDLGIVEEVHDLGVTRGMGADLLVAGVRGLPAHEPHLGNDHALDVQERVLDMPEASSRECGFHQTLSFLHLLTYWRSTGGTVTKVFEISRPAKQLSRRCAS
jgi:hypothetical protein